MRGSEIILIFVANKVFIYLDVEPNYLSCKCCNLIDKVLHVSNESVAFAF